MEFLHAVTYLINITLIYQENLRLYVLWLESEVVLLIVIKVNVNTLTNCEWQLYIGVWEVLADDISNETGRQSWDSQLSTP